MSILDVLSSHLRPFVLLFTSLSHLPGALLARRDADSPSLRESWFLRLWLEISPFIRESASPRVAALLQGRSSRGAVTDEAVHEPVGGRVLEIGAGTGVWAKLIAEQPGVETVFGIEPNRASGKALRGVVKKEGLEGKYVVVPAGIEDAGEWVERGSVDCVVTVLCMCSIPDPQRIAKEVYGYLKPGGRWYVMEHVKTEGTGWWMRFYQCTFSSFPDFSAQSLSPISSFFHQLQIMIKYANAKQLS